MRLTCPKCMAEYEVDETAIPPSGRDVQCAACGTVWFQDPKPLMEGGTPATAGTAPLPPLDDDIRAILQSEAEFTRQVRGRRGGEKDDEDALPAEDESSVEEGIAEEAPSPPSPEAQPASDLQDKEPIEADEAPEAAQDPIKSESDSASPDEDLRAKIAAFAAKASQEAGAEPPQGVISAQQQYAALHTPQEPKPPQTSIDAEMTATTAAAAEASATTAAAEKEAEIATQSTVQAIEKLPAAPATDQKDNDTKQQHDFPDIDALEEDMIARARSGPKPKIKPRKIPRDFNERKHLSPFRLGLRVSLLIIIAMILLHILAPHIPKSVPVISQMAQLSTRIIGGFQSLVLMIFG